MNLYAGWLDDLTNWFKDQFKALWDAFVAFMGDLIVQAIESVCDFFATAIESIPVPDFITQYSLDSLLGQAGPTIGWLVSTFKIGQCLTIIAAGVTFRLLRKLFTLGQW